MKFLMPQVGGHLHGDYSLLVPYDILNILGEPKFVQMSWHMKQRRIVIRTADMNEEGALDVPEQKYEKALFALPRMVNQNNPIDAMGWGDTAYAVETRLVRDKNDVIYLMIDLKSGKPADTKEICGTLYTPECLYTEDDDGL